MDMDFVVCFSAMMAKARYEKSLGEYRRKPFFERAFSPAPADPVKGFSLTQLQMMTESSFVGDYPHLNVASVERDGSRFMASTRLSIMAGDPPSVWLHCSALEKDKEKLRTEVYRLGENGEGFVLCSDSHADRLSDSLGLLSVRTLLDYYKGVELFLGSPEARAVSSFESLSRIPVDLERLSVILINCNRRKDTVAEMRDSVKAAEGLPPVNSSREACGLRLQMLSIQGTSASLSSYNGYGACLMYDVLRKRFIEMDTVGIYERERLLGKVRSYRMEDIMSAAGKAVSLQNPNLGQVRFEKAKVEMFTGMALDAGRSLKDIKDFGFSYLSGKHLENIVTPQYELVHERKAGVYMKAILERTDSAFRNGIRDSAKVEIQTPGKMFEMSMEKISEKSEAASFLKDIDKLSHRLSLDELVGVGESLYKSGSPVSPKAVASVALGQDAALRSIEDGYYSSLGRDFSRLAKEQNCSAVFKSDITPVNILSGEIYTTAVSIESDVERGRFLADAGVGVRHRLESVSDAVVSAAKQMYNGGNIQGVMNTNRFRENWAGFIERGRTGQGRQAVKSQNLLHKKGPGKSLS